MQNIMFASEKMKTGITVLAVVLTMCGCSAPKPKAKISELEAARIAWQVTRRESPPPAQVEKMIRERRLLVESQVRNGRQVWQVRFGTPDPIEGQVVQVNTQKPSASVAIAGGPTPWVVGVDAVSGEILWRHQTLLR